MLEPLRPGDIITHCARGLAAGDRGAVDPAAVRAYPGSARREAAFRDPLTTPLAGADGMEEQFPRDLGT